jgi:cytidine deaminase
MPPSDLEADDHALIAAARATLEAHYKPFWHTVSAALRLSDGRIVTGLHLGATVGRLAICAESVAVGRAIIEGGGAGIVAAVAMRHPKPGETGEMAVVPPCGACRELLTDHAPDTAIIVPTPGGLRRWPVRDLLPLPYQR